MAQQIRYGGCGGVAGTKTWPGKMKRQEACLVCWPAARSLYDVFRVCISAGRTQDNVFRLRWLDSCPSAANPGPEVVPAWPSTGASSHPAEAQVSLETLAGGTRVRVHEVMTDSNMPVDRMWQESWEACASAANSDIISPVTQSAPNPTKPSVISWQDCYKRATDRCSST